MRILIISPVDPAAVARLRERHDVVCAYNADAATLRAAIVDRDAVILRSGVKLDAAAMALAPDLRLVVRAGSGTDNIDLDHLAARRIALVRVPEPGAQAVAELTFALMLALARGVRTADAELRQGHWAKYEIEGRLISGKVLGVVGAGNIGRRVGQIGAALGMRPLGCVEHPTPEATAALERAGMALAPFERVVAEADFLTLHVPLTPSTRYIVGSDVLARMKPGSFLVNMARGGVVDEAALHAALVRGDRLRGAALDVHEHEGEGRRSPLADLPNVVLTPHIGASTVDTQRQIGERVVEIVEQHAGALPVAVPA